MQVYYLNITYRCNSNCIFCAANHPLWHDEREMSVSEIENFLSQHNISPEDRVVVNGGEPTMHREFWRVMDTINQYGATIDLFTNGIKCKNEDFVKQLLEYEKLHIRIPLFGSSEKLHDRLTGIMGNFNATTKGLDLLCKHINGHISLEIKLLMSKATVNENEKIYDLIRSRWSHPAVGISLNPLLISECVIKQKELLIEPYEEMMKKSEVLIRRALLDKSDFSTALIPYCTYPNQELLNMCCRNKTGGKIIYASPGHISKIDSIEWRKACLKCCYVNECNGFTQNYIGYFGEEVIKPFILI